MSGIKSYDDEMFINTVNKFGPNTAYGFAKGLKMHQTLLRRRLKELADSGMIVQVSTYPVKYGPKPDEKLPPPEPNLEEKKAFFNQAMELPQMEMEILNLLRREGLGSSVIGMATSNICKILGYSKTIVTRALNHLKTNGYVMVEKRGKNTYWFISNKETKKEESRAMLSVGSLLNIIRNAFTDLESQVGILTAQNEAFRNVSENTHFKNRTLVNEETIREDERKIVFKAISKIVRLSPEIIADWYKAGK